MTTEEILDHRIAVRRIRIGQATSDAILLLRIFDWLRRRGPMTATALRRHLCLPYTARGVVWRLLGTYCRRLDPPDGSDYRIKWALPDCVSSSPDAKPSRDACAP